MTSLRFTRDSVCMADDVDAPHDAVIEVDGDADALAVARMLLRSPVLAYTRVAVWSLSLGVDEVVFGRGVFRSFAWPVGPLPLEVQARDVEEVHASYHAQQEPRLVLAELQRTAVRRYRSAAGERIAGPSRLL